MKRLLLALCGLIACSPATLLAWSNHSLGTWLALADLPELRQAEPVQVERLEDFLAAEAVALQQVLDEQEARAREELPDYPARPDSLRWTADGSGDRRRAFLMALRVSPEIRLAYFVQALPGLELPAAKVLPAQDVLVFRKLSLWNEWRFLAVEPGERVSPVRCSPARRTSRTTGTTSTSSRTTPARSARSTASAPSPSVMRVSNTRLRRRSTSATTTSRRSSIRPRRSSPAPTRSCACASTWRWRGWRSSGHPYWGYRFLGWALHYVQDLTQPYHAKALPGENTATLMWTAIQAALGDTSGKEAAIERVATRHTEVEKYQADWLRRLLREGRNDDPLLRAYADTSDDDRYPPFGPGYLQDVVAQESYEAADEFDERIGLWLAGAQPGQGFSAGNQPAGGDRSGAERGAGEADPAFRRAHPQPGEDHPGQSIGRWAIGPPLQNFSPGSR